MKKPICPKCGSEKVTQTTRGGFTSRFTKPPMPVKLLNCCLKCKHEWRKKLTFSGLAKAKGKKP